MEIAVIGGGFTGVLTAYLLEKEGVFVKLYEKTDRIGGHIKTIKNKNILADLGTVCSFSKKLKNLLIDLKIDYKERFTYKSFIDENYNYIEHMLREDVVLLIEELKTLNIILNKYSKVLNDVNFGHIPEELLISFDDFLKIHNFRFINEIITPYLSSFGFGSSKDVQAYYVLKIFNFSTINSFLQGKKSLFINDGFESLIDKLSAEVSNIQYSSEIINIEKIENKIKVETTFNTNYFDKVLITTKLSNHIIKDSYCNSIMNKISTNSFISCAFKVSNKDLVPTYYKNNLGKKNKTQFFYVSKYNHQTTLIAYAYGTLNKHLISSIEKDLKLTKITIENLIAVNQWDIFPHFDFQTLTPTIYTEILEYGKLHNIYLIGSLITEPNIDKLYLSVKNTISSILSETIS